MFKIGTEKISPFQYRYIKPRQNEINNTFKINNDEYEAIVSLNLFLSFKMAVYIYFRCIIFN